MNKPFFYTIAIIILLTGISSKGNCQSQMTMTTCKNKLFENYLNKFNLYSLPIKTDTITNYSGNKVTLEEFNCFIKDSSDTFWKYRLYSDNSKSFFEYRPLCKFKIGDKIGLLCACFYFDDDMTKDRGDVFLSIFDSKGTKISHLPSISGGRFDNFASDILFDEINCKAIITENYHIEITCNIYSWEDEKEHISKKYYHITNEGKIEEIVK